MTGERVLVIGDIHNQANDVLPRVEITLAREPMDRVVFLGDYVNQWDNDAQREIDSVNCLCDWVLRNSQFVPIDLIVGNHDVAYIMDRTDPCYADILPASPGFQTAAYSAVHARLADFHWKIALGVGDVLFTHAGVTRQWASSHIPTALPSAAGVAKALNDLGEAGLWWALYSAGRARGGAGIPGPLWADRSELIAAPLLGMTQIVGHTPVRSIELFALPDRHHLVFCDTMSRYGDPRLTAIGDGSFAIVDASMQPIQILPLLPDFWPRTLRN